MSLLYGLSSDKILGGAIGWSGHLHQSFDLKNLNKLPLFINHGKYDNVVPFKMALKSYESILKTERVTFEAYDLDHEVSIKQV